MVLTPCQIPTPENRKPCTADLLVSAPANQAQTRVSSQAAVFIFTLVDASGYLYLQNLAERNSLDNRFDRSN